MKKIVFTAALATLLAACSAQEPAAVEENAVAATDATGGAGAAEENVKEK